MIFLSVQLDIFSSSKIICSFGILYLFYSFMYLVLLESVVEISGISWRKIRGVGDLEIIIPLSRLLLSLMLSTKDATFYRIRG